MIKFESDIWSNSNMWSKLLLIYGQSQIYGQILTAKFVKIFSLESFPLYGTYYVHDSCITPEGIHVGRNDSCITSSHRLPDIVHKDLKSTLRVLYSIFGKYKSHFQQQPHPSTTPTSQGNTSAV